MLDSNTFTDDPAAAVIAFPLKLASLFETAIWAVPADALIPSEVAFSADEWLTTIRELVFASKPMVSRIARVLSTSTSTFGMLAFAALIAEPPLFFRTVLII